MKRLTESFKNLGDHAAFIYRDKPYTYSWLLSSIEEYCSLIKQFGCSIYSINSDYSPWYVSMFLALYECGKCIVPICVPTEEKVNRKLSAASVEATIDFTSDGPNFEVRNPGLELPPLVEEVLRAGDSAIVLFSSGTTGAPKAMVHNLDTLLGVYKIKKRRNLRFLIFLMPDHIGGLNTLFKALSMGVTLVIPESRDPDHVCYLVENHKVNVLPTSPTFLNLMLISESHKRHDLSALRMITYGTEPMPEQLLKRLRREFPKVRFLQTFGTSETGVAATLSKSSESLFFRMQERNTEWKVVNGELWLRSRSQILGYLNCDSPFTEDGWFQTGDLVETTQDGYIRIIGRTTNIINVGGEKVLPQEVEDTILELPEVAHVVVRGESHPMTGQVVVATVFPSSNGSVDDKALALKARKHCRNRMQAHAVPVKVHIARGPESGKKKTS